MSKKRTTKKEQKTKEIEKRKVLFFDDEPFISKILAKNLEFFDYDVTFVSEIDHLFEELCNQNIQFDIVILDTMAPVPEKENKHVTFDKKEIEEMDGGLNTGVILAKRIWEKKTDLPILFLSAKELTPDSINKYNVNNSRWAYLRKPELAMTIKDKLDELLD